MSDYHNKRAVEILRKIRYATIATTSKDGNPWNSPVAHEYDDQLNIYWFSDKQNQHSQNVRENEDVFIVIYDSTVPEGDGEGVYIEAKAVELTDPDEILRARKIKKGEDYEGKPNDFTGDAIRRVYKATPQRVWMNDAEITDGVFIRDYRVDIPLETIRSLLTMPEQSLQQKLRKADVMIHEPVASSTGEVSDFYVDVKKAYGNPELLEELARAAVETLDSQTTCIVASGYGGIPLGVEVSRLSNLPLAMVRDTEKNHGEGGMFDGYVPQPHDFVAIVDDIFTSGSSLARMVDMLNENGVTVVSCTMVVARGNTEKFHLPVASLFTPGDLA